MPVNLKPGILFLLTLCFCFATKAQHLSFRQLGVQEGMPSNLTSHACFDSTGQMWVSTADGLINYDGTRIKQYVKETHPGLPVNEHQYLHCDSRNRIWICTGAGLALVDEQRRIQRIIINDTLKNGDVDYCIEVAGLGVIAFAPNKTFILRENKKLWEPYDWFDNAVKKGEGMLSLKAFNKTSYMLSSGTRVLLVNFLKQEIVTEVKIEKAARIVVCKINEKELMAINGASFEMYRINIATNSIIKKYTGLKDEQGNSIETAPTYCDIGSNGIIYITTRSRGLVSFDPVTEIAHVYSHDPLNETSVSSNFLRRVFCHPKGYMAITSIDGVSYTSLNTLMLRQQKKFVDEKGNIIDDINMVGEDVQGRIWLRSLNSLFVWDAKTNKAVNITPPNSSAENETNIITGSIFRDRADNMWVGYNGKGIAKFNSAGKQLSFLTREKNGLPSDRIRIIRQLDDNMLMIGTENGFFVIDPETFKIDSLAEHPLLKSIAKKRIVDILPDREGVWIASSPYGGAYYYNFRNKTLKSITQKDGLVSDRVYCIAKDQLNNIYIGTFDGLNIIDPGGTITVVNKNNGLRHTRVENLKLDEQGRIWITNHNSLICYDPADKSFTYFDEQNGVSNAGFVLGQAVLTKDGKILFCNDGLLIADTKKIIPKEQLTREIIVNRLYDDGGYDLLDPSRAIKLKHNEGKISFYYLAHTLIAANRFFYRYKMESLDTGWQQPTKNNQVTYNLKPGKYVFHIQTSYSEGDWKNTNANITIIVMPPWWQTWWFRALVVISIGGILYLLYRRRIRVIKDKAAIKQQMTELEGKALRSQMNPHFIFNSLNAIQELIITKNFDEGYQYLSNFSKLLRQVLNNSEKNTIPLSSEIEMIRLQLSLESLRFKNSFNYYIETGKNIEPELISIPPLLLQPYVENAVWHGLRHKEGEKNLWIRINEDEGKLNIVIEDDGIGRQKAEEIKKHKLGAEQFESKGSLLSQQRIKILDDLYPQGATVEIIDLQNEQQEAIGTKVKISLPINIR